MVYKKIHPIQKRLPPLEKLRVKNTVKTATTNECFLVLSSLLNCWASYGDSNKFCSNIELDLKLCMNSYKPKKPEKSSINYHAARLYPKLKKVEND